MSLIRSLHLFRVCRLCVDWPGRDAPRVQADPPVDVADDLSPFQSFAETFLVRSIHVPPLHIVIFFEVAICYLLEHCVLDGLGREAAGSQVVAVAV